MKWKCRGKQQANLPSPPHKGAMRVWVCATECRGQRVTPVLHMHDGDACALRLWSFQPWVTKGWRLQRHIAHVWPSHVHIRLPQPSGWQASRQKAGKVQGWCTRGGWHARGVCQTPPAHHITPPLQHITWYGLHQPHPPSDTLPPHFIHSASPLQFPIKWMKETGTGISAVMGDSTWLANSH